ELASSHLPKDSKPIQIRLSNTAFSSQDKVLDGVDVFICSANRDPNALASRLKQVAPGDTQLELVYITNRGIKVYPNPLPETFCTDHWRCRFLKKDQSKCQPSDIISLLQKICSAKLEIIKTENLYSFSGSANYSQIG
ncbi:MAG: NADP-dependent isocitrate dehydrogenase, partial [Oligoflexia bacterium]|nr:NADP-dependent isocitrate dehydrogenase [Oligoflexia bacterium]